MRSNGSFPREMAKVIEDINNLTSDTDPSPDPLYSTHFGYHIPFSLHPYDQPMIFQPDLDVISEADCLIGELPSLLPKSRPIFESTILTEAREVLKNWGNKGMRRMKRARGSAWFRVLMEAWAVESSWGCKGMRRMGRGRSVWFHVNSERGMKGPKGRPSWLPRGWKISYNTRMNGASAGVVDKVKKISHLPQCS